MNAITNVLTILLTLTSSVCGLVVFHNHRYGGAEAFHLTGYRGLQNQVLKERKAFLMKFVGDRQPAVPTGISNDFKPKDHIAPHDLVGVVPPDMFAKIVKNTPSKRKTPGAPSAAKTVDSETGASQLVHSHKNVWADSAFTPERIRNHKYAPAHKPSYGLYEKPYGRVRVHTYRGPQKEYWSVPLHHKPQKKTFTPWGYYVKQPVGSEKHKFHSPLDLTFRFD